MEELGEDENLLGSSHRAETDLHIQNSIVHQLNTEKGNTSHLARQVANIWFILALAVLLFALALVIAVVAWYQATHGGGNGSAGLPGMNGQNCTYQGPWMSGTTYTHCQLVTYNLELWITAPNIPPFVSLIPPGANSTQWDLAAAQGEQGINGTDGTNGRNGTNGINGMNGRNGTNGINGTMGTPGLPAIFYYTWNASQTYSGGWVGVVYLNVSYSAFAIPPFKSSLPPIQDTQHWLQSGPSGMAGGGSGIPTDVTGFGPFVLQTDARLFHPTIYDGLFNTINNVTITPVETNATLTLSEGSTLAVDGPHSITFVLDQDWVLGPWPASLGTGVSPALGDATTGSCGLVRQIDPTIIDATFLGGITVYGTETVTNLVVNQTATIDTLVARVEDIQTLIVNNTVIQLLSAVQSYLNTVSVDILQVNVSLTSPLANITQTFFSQLNTINAQVDQILTVHQEFVKLLNATSASVADLHFDHAHGGDIIAESGYFTFLNATVFEVESLILDRLVVKSAQIDFLNSTSINSESVTTKTLTATGAIQGDTVTAVTSMTTPLLNGGSANFQSTSTQSASVTTLQVNGTATLDSATINSGSANFQSTSTQSASVTTLQVNGTATLDSATINSGSANFASTSTQIASVTTLQVNGTATLANLQVTGSSTLPEINGGSANFAS